MSTRRSDQIVKAILEETTVEGSVTKLLTNLHELFKEISRDSDIIPEDELEELAEFLEMNKGTIAELIVQNTAFAVPSEVSELQNRIKELEAANKTLGEVNREQQALIDSAPPVLDPLALIDQSLEAHKTAIGDKKPSAIDKGYLFAHNDLKNLFTQALEKLKLTEADPEETQA